MAGSLLHSARVTLRAMEPEDLDVLYKVENLTDFWKYGTSNVPYSRYALHRFIAETRNDIFADGQLRLMITSAQDGRVVGCIDLVNFDPQHRRAEVGVLVLPEFQQQGWGHEALELLRTYAGFHLGIHQLYAYVAVENRAAERLFVKAGFVQAATLTHWLRQGTVYADAALYRYIFSN